MWFPWGGGIWGCEIPGVGWSRVRSVGPSRWRGFGVWVPWGGGVVLWGDGAAPSLPQAVNMCHEPSWWTWSPAPWTRCARDPSGRSSDPITSFLVSAPCPLGGTATVGWGLHGWGVMGVCVGVTSWDDGVPKGSSKRTQSVEYGGDVSRWDNGVSVGQWGPQGVIRSPPKGRMGVTPWDNGVPRAVCVPKGWDGGRPME